jgi:hypothetical protein
MVKDYYQKKDIIELYNKDFFRKVNRNKDLLRTKKINNTLLLYHKDDVQQLYEGKLLKCDVCGITKDLYLNNYRICNSCRNKKISTTTKERWSNENYKNLVIKKITINNRLRGYNSKKQQYNKIKKFIEKHNNILLTTFEEYMVSEKLLIKCVCETTYNKYFINIKNFKNIGCNNCNPHGLRMTKEEFFKKISVYKKYCSFEKTFFNGLDNNIVVTDKKYGDYVVNARRFLYGKMHPKRSIKSKGEQEIIDFIKTFYKGVVINNERKVLNTNPDNNSRGLEIDIFIPEKNLGIEYNGLFNHCEYSLREDVFVNKNKHLIKQTIAEERGMRLIQINSYQWLMKKDIVKSFIRSFFETNKKVGARECLIKELNIDTTKEFINVNHLQGYSRSSVKLGLFSGEELLMVMTFGKPRMSNKYEWELIRLCTKQGVSVLGGANKLFKYFVKHYNPLSVISYCDQSLFIGSVYETMGFIYSHTSKPNYFYTKDYKILYPRQSFQKHKLKGLLEFFDESLSEWDNMFLNGYNRYWDCGNKIYIYTS